MRILNITNQVPYPAVSGAPLRTYNMLRRLAREHEVYLAAFTETDEHNDGLANLLQTCREVVTVRRKSLKQSMHFGKILTSLLHGEPPETRLSFSEDLAREIQDLVNRVNFDIVLIEHGSMGLYLEALPAKLRKKAVWVLHDIDFDKFMRIANITQRKGAKARAWIHAKMMKRWQPQFASQFRYCVTVSEPDRKLLLSANGNLRVCVSPNGVDTNHYRPLPDETTAAEILFVGNMGYEPNADAAVYFCREVLPLVRREVPDVKVWIVGIDPGPSVTRLGGDKVFITGAVPDVRPYYKRSRVCIVPLRAGSGTRLKILEAMALGRPVVSTSIGCEGLNATEGENLLIADDSKRFAEQIVRLLTDSEFRAGITQNARQFVTALYDWDVIAERLMNDFRQFAGQNGNGEDCSSDQVWVDQHLQAPSSEPRVQGHA